MPWHAVRALAAAAHQPHRLDVELMDVFSREPRQACPRCGYLSSTTLLLSPLLDEARRSSMHGNPHVQAKWLPPDPPLMDMGPNCLGGGIRRHRPTNISRDLHSAQNLLCPPENWLNTSKTHWHASGEARGMLRK